MNNNNNNNAFEIQEYLSGNVFSVNEKINKKVKVKERERERERESESE